ncbi:hypothetical protein IAD21_03697 [Abditibacteriota bacterium]|nr:hypothetical protein IAD21_03697 [Abditibacteriota bacterium]
MNPQTKQLWQRLGAVVAFYIAFCILGPLLIFAVLYVILFVTGQRLSATTQPLDWLGFLEPLALGLATLGLAYKLKRLSGWRTISFSAQIRSQNQWHKEILQGSFAGIFSRKGRRLHELVIRVDAPRTEVERLLDELPPISGKPLVSFLERLTQLPEQPTAHRDGERLILRVKRRPRLSPFVARIEDADTETVIRGKVVPEMPERFFMWYGFVVGLLWELMLGAMMMSVLWSRDWSGLWAGLLVSPVGLGIMALSIWGLRGIIHYREIQVSTFWRERFGAQIEFIPRHSFGPWFKSLPSLQKYS